MLHLPLQFKEKNLFSSKSVIGATKLLKF